MDENAIKAKTEEEVWLQEVQEPIKQKFREREQALKKDEAPSPELQAKMEAECAMRASAERGQGLAIGGIAGQIHWSATNQIRHAAFSSAMDIHRHRGTGHEEVIESARAFEAYLKGE